MSKYSQISEEQFDKLINDPETRIEVTRESFWYFVSVYFHKYIKYKTAKFQKEIIYQLEASARQNIYLTAFRDSGKSTFVTTAYPLWAILGRQSKMYILIFCKTQSQAKQALNNIRAEADHNALLKEDLGPFKTNEEYDRDGQWTSTTLEFLNTGARIKVASVDEGIRGLRHMEYRPDVIILDDVEDLNSVRTKEGRDKTYKWFKGDVIAAGDIYTTRVIVVGNLLHEDCLLMRLKQEVRSGEESGIFLEYPLLKDGVCLWPGKYPDKEAIEMQRKELGSNIEWQREFLLNIVPDIDQVMFKEWFKRYDMMPTLDKSFVGVVAGIDLAFTKHDYSDYTAIVIAYAFYFERELYLYILPNPINERILSPDLIERCKLLNEYYKKQDLHIQFLVEQAGQQIGVIDHLQKAKLDARGVKVGKQDKRFRQSLTAPQIKSAHVLFPHKGCEKLEYQLTHFGVGHDDLADALATLVLGTMEHPPRYRHSVGDIIVGGEPRHYPDGTDFNRHRITLDTRF